MKNSVKHWAFLLVLLCFGRVYGNPTVNFVEAARNQIGKTLWYDPGYAAIAYPQGDVPLERGVCTDVIIRAMRAAFGLDLQKLVHEDISAHFSAYPKRWGLDQPDKNIDHRRVPNLQTFFKRKGWSLPVSDKPEMYKPGDMVTCVVPPHLPHIMIVSDKKNSRGIPYVIHNIGAGTKEEDRLFEFALTGHYRIEPADPVATVVLTTSSVD